MNTCNDPKCPLNRQGVKHEIHELIESRPVKNPCKDGRCAMNRMGIPHDSHDEEPISERKNNVGESPNKNFKPNSKINKLTQEQVEAERIRRMGIAMEQEDAEQRIIDQSRIHSQTILEKPTSAKSKPKSGLFSRFSSKSNIPSTNQILQSHDPYVIFGLKPETTCQEIKLQFKELARIYNASRGSINKTKSERDQITAVQSRINTAYDTLRRRHCG